MPNRVNEPCTNNSMQCALTDAQPNSQSPGWHLWTQEVGLDWLFVVCIAPVRGYTDKLLSRIHGTAGHHACGVS